MNACDTKTVLIPVMDTNKWNKACTFALANSTIFVVLSLLFYLIKPDSLVAILSVPVLFFVGSMFSFLFLIQSGGAISPIAWFVLGAGVFFGLGPVGGGMHVHPWTAIIHSDSTLYLVQINLLNACSVLLVLLAAYPLIYMRKHRALQADMAHLDIMQFMRGFFPFVIAIAAVGISLEFILFPWPENLLLRSLTGKLYPLIPSVFLLLGFLWSSLDWKSRLFGLSLLLVEMFNGMVGFTKYQILAALLALIIGFLLTRRSIKFIVSVFAVTALVLLLMNPLITLGRAHIDYDAGNNSISSRLTILGDAIRFQISDAEFPFGSPANSASFSYLELEQANKEINKAIRERYGSLDGKLRALLLRFDIAPIQGYLLNEYNTGRPGKSLHSFWAVFVPRIFWSEKPIITRFGPELHKQYFKDPNQISSSLAPTFSADAYWNYGPLGVIVVSVLLGLGIGWLTRCSQFALSGLDPAYFLIAFPVVIWASFVESWVVATYLGEFIIFVVLLISARIALKLWYQLQHKMFSKSVNQY